jgi:nicotinate-nucleotide adenylyltransferase
VQRVGVFGASFDPPTLGHRDVIIQAISAFDEILLVPSVSHAFQKNLTPIKNRLAMLKIFVDPWQQEGAHQVKIVNIEAVIQRTAPSQYVYTYDVLSALTKRYRKQGKAVQIHFIAGPDIARPDVWQRFYRFKEIEERWPLFIAKERVAIRSTTVREYIGASPPDLKEKLITWVGEPIMQYILKRQLYHSR